MELGTKKDPLLDQWKVILTALLLTTFLPLFLWTGLFIAFGWKLFLFVAMGVTALFMFGDKIVKLPFFKSIVQMLVPFGMTYRFYRALLAGKEVREQEGSGAKAWWATFRRLLFKEDKPPDQPKPLDESKPPKVQKVTKQKKQKRWTLGSTKQSSNKEVSSSTEEIGSSEPVVASAPRYEEPGAKELDQMLYELKSKMKKDNK